MADEIPPDVRSEIHRLESMLEKTREETAAYRREEVSARIIYDLQMKQRPNWISRFLGATTNYIADTERDIAKARTCAEEGENVIATTNERIEHLLYNHLIEHDRKYRCLHESVLRLNRLQEGANQYSSTVNNAMSELEYAIDEVTWTSDIDTVDVDDAGSSVRDAVRAVKHAREETKHFQNALQEYNTFAKTTADGPRNEDHDDCLVSRIYETENLVAAFSLKTFAEAETELRSMKTKIGYIKGRIQDDLETTEKRKTAYLARCRRLCTANESTGVTN